MKKRIISILCSIMCIMNITTPVLAQDYTVPTDEAEVPLAFSKESIFTVTLPEAISSKGNTEVNFDYSVEGDIEADKKVAILVEDGDTDRDGTQIVLSDATGQTKDADISISKTDFAPNEIVDKVTETGIVSMEDLSAGKWSGVAKFIIGLNHEHNYVSEVTKEASCTEDGVETFTCHCGDTYTEDILALGHSYGEWETVSLPNCTDSGSKQRVCDVCGYVDTDELVALGHNWESTYTVDKTATCTEAGSKSIHCADCDAVKDSTVIPATGHSYGTVTYSWATNGKTCTSTRTCANNSSHKETESATITNTVKVAATCTAKGTTTYTAKFTNIAFATQTKDVQDIAALGHNYSSTYTVDKAATCTTAGSKSQHCTRCSAKQNVTSIAATGHNAVNGYCTKCGVKVAGLYNSNGVLLCTWENSGINIGIDYSSSSSSSNYYKTATTSGYYVLTNRYPKATKVFIPDSVTSLGENAFCGCSGLTLITLSNNITNISKSAFLGCSGLTSITLPNSVTIIGGQAFDNCKGLTSITIPSSVTSIGPYAFNNTGLTSVTFKTLTGWYAGSSAGAKTISISSNDLANTSTAATYLKQNYSSKYWTR